MNGRGRRRIPEGFGEEFLFWFRDRTEAAWAEYETQDFMEEGALGGKDWQAGTKWEGGLSEREVKKAEKRWGMVFPPEHRLFLRTLHTVDRPMQGAKFIDEVNKEATNPPSFFDWRKDEEIEGALKWAFSGLEFDLEKNKLWLESWGPRKELYADRLEELKRRHASAPKLAPLYQHRYLLAEPSQPGNPVLSIWQTDIIFYGPDFRTWLLIEFADLLGLDREKQEKEAWKGMKWKMKDIPFWGELSLWHFRPRK